MSDYLFTEVSQHVHKELIKHSHRVCKLSNTRVNYINTASSLVKYINTKMEAKYKSLIKLLQRSLGFLIQSAGSASKLDLIQIFFH